MQPVPPAEFADQAASRTGSLFGRTWFRRAPLGDAGSGQALFGRRRVGAIAAVGISTYALALVATLPARMVVPPAPGRDVAGTVWNGEALLEGAYRLEWHWAPWRSLAALAFAADMRLSGAGTDIVGTATGRGDRLLIEGLSGRGDGALLATFVPGLPFACDATLSFDVPRLLADDARSAAVGEVRVDGATCAADGESAGAPLPPLLLRASRIGDGTHLELAPVGRDRLHLIEGGISAGRLVLATTPAGGTMLPFARGFRIDRPL